MVKIDWEKLSFAFMPTKSNIRFHYKDGKWSEGELTSSYDITMSVAANVMHYGQAAFEGGKAFRCKDGKVRAFRPQSNAERMHRTAIRTCMAPVEVDMFMDSLKRVVNDNLDYIPPYGTGGSLYVRPLLIGSGPQIGVAPSSEYTFMIMVMPVGPYYKGGLAPVRAAIYDDYDRAAPRGVGHVKVAGNYAASLYAHVMAKHDGFPVELYLDAKEHKYVDEFATSNFFGIKPDGTYVTPNSHSVLPSVTNNTLRQIAVDIGMPVETRPIPYEELETFAEIGACGTAVVVTPVSEIWRGDKVIKVPTGDKCGPVLEKLYHHVQGIQYGELPDTHNWCVEL